MGYGCASPKEALHAAARNQNLTTVQELLLSGAPVNHAGKEHGETAMYAAAAQGDVQLGIMLHRYGAELSCRAREGGRTPLHVAAQYGHCEMVTWLLCVGADPEAQTTRDFRPLSGPPLVPAGTTPLELARMFENTKVVELFETGSWRNTRRQELAKLRRLREGGRAWLKAAEPFFEPEFHPIEAQPTYRELTHHEAECIDRLLGLGNEVGPHSSDGILLRVLEYADW